ncbi:hypothetical protein B0H14DRAFT_3149959 [Mycena olivaceomarginata]|nr:hypothetical protein B0H14DRAFT_3149959 [Mycena olivaceomarginata]
MVYRAISDDFKERALWLWDHGYLTEDFCDILDASQSSLYRWKAWQVDHSSVIPPPNPLRGRPHTPNPDQTHDLLSLVSGNPSLSADPNVLYIYAHGTNVYSATPIDPAKTKSTRMQSTRARDHKHSGGGLVNNYARQRPEVFSQLEYAGNWQTIFQQDVYQRRMMRQELRISEILHDLLASSLVPLTKNITSAVDYRSQAIEFLSCFRDGDVEWDVNVAALPSIQRHAIYGSTENARRKGVDWRFQRFRFPYVHFEWHLQTSYSELNARISQGANRPIPIKFLWKAWTRNQAASAVIAVGSCDDTLIFVSLPNAQHLTLVISRRVFNVTKVIQPELMKPVPYLARNPAAASALAASLQPVFADRNHVIGTFLTAIGILAAAISILANAVGLALKWIEGNSARNVHHGAHFRHTLRRTKIRVETAVDISWG